MSTDRHDRSDLDAKTDVGPGTGRGITPRSPEEAEFDREIDVRNVLWIGAVLVALALVVHLLMWWLLRGFGTYEEKRDVRLTPIETEVRPQAPPGPRLEVSPSENLRRMRAEEDAQLGRAGWVDRRQGTVRVPIDVAIDVIASRGIAPEVVGGTGSAASPDQTRMQIGGTAADVRRPGATTQMALPPAPAQPPPQEKKEGMR